MKKFAVVVMVAAEDGVNGSVASEKNIQSYVRKVLAENMGQQADRGIALKVKGFQVGKAAEILI